MQRLFILLLITFLYSRPGYTQYALVTADQDISSSNMGTLYGNGVSFFDFNHDGWDDLSLACGALEPKFYINNAGQFEEVTLGVLNADAKQVHSIQWVDWDNDGDSDLFLSRRNGKPLLFRNDGDLVLTDISATSGVDQGTFFYMASGWCDYDHDGFLDFYLPKYYNPIPFPDDPFASQLYRGNGDGTFTDVTAAAGAWLPPRPCFQAVWFDYDNDGWQDLYLIIDRELWTNELFHNNGDGTFTNVSAESNTDIAIEAMTGTIGDFDNDLDFDIYVTNGWTGNVLLSNNGNGTFDDISVEAGVTVGKICWGAQWIDYDNDTWQDLFVATTGNFYGPCQNEFLINNQDGTFTSGNEETGILGDVDPTMATAMGDINNDGYYDYVNSNNAPYMANLWQSESGENHWLGVELHGTVSNRDAFGALITLHCDGEVYVRYTHGGENYQGQNSGKEIFGLGATSVVDSVEITWPRGLHEVYYNIPADQYLYLIEGASANTTIPLSMNEALFCEFDSVSVNAGNWTVDHWSDSSVTEELVIYEPGTYYAVVVDSLGNLFHTEPVVVAEYELPLVTLLPTTPACNGESSGSISLTIDNGMAWTQLTWNDSTYTGDVLEDLAAGAYDYVLTDENGCVSSGSMVLTEPSLIETLVTTTDVLCYGEDSGNISLVVSGGTPEYSILWNDGAYSGDVLEDIPAGAYDFVVMDENGCESIGTIVLTQPSMIETSTVVTHVLCHGENSGSVEFTISGGTPDYSVLWNGNDPQAMNAGSYSIEVQDSQECSVFVDFEIEEPEPLDANLTTTDEHEDLGEGSATIEVSGGVLPYDISWSSGEEDIETVTGLAANDYMVVVQDSNGCMLEIPFTIDFIENVGELAQLNYNVYPNPARIVIYTQPAIRGAFAIYDQAGKCVLRGMNAASVSIESLAPGFYCLAGSDSSQRVYFMKQ